MAKLLERKEYMRNIKDALRRSPVVALLGPRQCGKTTMARQISDAAGKTEFYDLENPVDLNRLSAPVTALRKLPDLL